MTKTQGTMRHTAGQWQVGTKKPYSIEINDGRGFALADVDGNNAEANANARLIAAAPALLAACQAAVSDLEDWVASDEEREYDVTPEGLRALARQLQNALTAATGGQP